MRSFFKILIGLSILLSACGEGDPEKEVVDNFFSAVQKGDATGVQQVSVAAFDGKPESWEIVERGSESEAPFELADLEAQLEEQTR